MYEVTVTCYHCTHGIGLCTNTSDEDLLRMIKEKEDNCKEDNNRFSAKKPIIKRKRQHCYSVDAFCPDCSKYMRLKSSGHVQSSYPPSYGHVCEGCDKHYWLDKSYPYIMYSDVESLSD